MRRWMCAGLAGVMVVSMIGCSAKKEENIGNSTNLMTEQHTTERPQETEEAISSEEQTDQLEQSEVQEPVADGTLDDQFRGDMADFSISLLQENLNEKKEANVMVSPLSVMEALAMTQNGADGETLQQMSDVLAGGRDRKELNQQLSIWITSLPNSDGAKFHMANGIWFKDAENTFQPNQEFLDYNQQYFHAGIYKAPFDDSTKEEINKWVSDQTDQMIPEMLKKISTDAVMYLVNAMAFDAEWKSPYTTNEVHEAEFTTANGEKQQISMMFGDESTYLEDEHATGFIKPYKEGYSFVALLPEEGMSVAEYVDSLDGEKFVKIMDNQTFDTVSTSIPKFTSDYDASLVESLQQMGMTDAFDKEKADFSKLGRGIGNIYISDVIHKTYISVDEKGTKAGAATAVEMTMEMAMMIEKQVYLDRPFVYAIIDNETSLPLFMGVYQGEIK